jgi:branched-chain amino acid transport system substrate-binding protein
MMMEPKPQTVAIVGADAEYAQNVLIGARANIEKLRLKIVYDRNYPPNTVDYLPIVRAIQATNPDIVFVASYPPDSVGMVRAINEAAFKPRMFGGGMIGLAFTAIKAQLGPLLNGIVANDTYVPEPTMKFPGVDEFLKRYQERAPAAGVDPLGYFLPPFAYAEMQILEQAVNAVGSIDQGKLAEYIHKTKFNTIIGEVKFGPIGEWEKSRLITVQYQNIQGSDINQFRQPGKQVILHPPEFKSGELIYPSPRHAASNGGGGGADPGGLRSARGQRSDKGRLSAAPTGEPAATARGVSARCESNFSMRERRGSQRATLWSRPEAPCPWGGCGLPVPGLA